MKGKYIFVAFFYLFGWLYYLINIEHIIFYAMAIYLILNLATVLHPDIFHTGVLRPLQIGIASSSFLYGMTNQSSMFLLGIFLVFSIIFLETEKIENFIIKTNIEKNTFVITTIRFFTTLIMPFAAVYISLLLRVGEQVLSPLVIIIYFSSLYVSSRWFDSITSFSIFMLFQMIIFIYVIDMYLFWNSVEITSMFVTIFVFLFIGYGRKGLLTYSKNN